MTTAIIPRRGEMTHQELPLDPASTPYRAVSKGYKRKPLRKEISKTCTAVVDKKREEIRTKVVDEEVPVLRPHTSNTFKRWDFLELEKRMRLVSPQDEETRKSERVPKASRGTSTIRFIRRKRMTRMSKNDGDIRNLFPGSKLLRFCNRIRQRRPSSVKARLKHKQRRFKEVVIDPERLSDPPEFKKLMSTLLQDLEPLKSILMDWDKKVTNEFYDEFIKDEVFCPKHQTDDEKKHNGDPDTLEDDDRPASGSGTVTEEGMTPRTEAFSDPADPTTSIHWSSTEPQTLGASRYFLRDVAVKVNDVLLNPRKYIQCPTCTLENLEKDIDETSTDVIPLEGFKDYFETMTISKLDNFLNTIRATKNKCECKGSIFKEVAPLYVEIRNWVRENFKHRPGKGVYAQNLYKTCPFLLKQFVNVEKAKLALQQTIYNEFPLVSEFELRDRKLQKGRTTFYVYLAHRRRAPYLRVLRPLTVTLTKQEMMLVDTHFGVQRNARDFCLAVLQYTGELDHYVSHEFLYAKYVEHARFRGYKRITCKRIFRLAVSEAFPGVIFVRGDEIIPARYVRVRSVKSDLWNTRCGPPPIESD